MAEPVTSIKMIVKQINSGDSLILRDQPRGGPPKEVQVGLCWISAPKMGRKGNQGVEVAEDLGAFEAREFLRKKLVGREILFTRMYSVPIGNAGPRDCGLVYLPSSPDVSMNEMLVEEGLAEVIKRTQNNSNPIYQKLLQLEELAQSGKKGKWAEQSSGNVDNNKKGSSGGKGGGFKRRIVLQEISQDNAEQLRGKTFKENAIVEYVQSADQMKVALLTNKAKNEWQIITLRLSGIKVPASYSAEGKFFVESRVLQRDVLVKVEQLQRTGDNPILYGSVFGGKDNQHNIAVALLKEGFGQVVDITLKLTPNPQQYRQAVSEAKEKKLRIWKDFKESEKTENGSSSKESFDGKVVEIINGDAMNVLSMKDNQVRKVFLASIRPPPRKADAPTDPKLYRALYDTPFMYEARELLRSRLIGKKVHVIIDYVQPKTDTFPEKTCATVKLNGQNIAELLVSRGLATVVKYRADEERKSCEYDLLLDAEIKAEKAKKGIYGGKEGQSKKVVDLSNDTAKAKSYMPSLVRSGLGGPKKEGTVEHVYSSTRVKLYIKKENCLINLIIGGINAPKATENQYGKEGYELVKSLVHQRDVQLSIENMDKVGNFIGYLYYEVEKEIFKNISLTLIEAGLASIRDSKDSQMIRAEEEARNAKKGLWKDWVPEEEEEEEEPEEVEEYKDDDNGEVVEGASEKEKAIANENKLKKKAQELQQELDKLEKVVVTEVSPDASVIFVQNISKGKQLEELLIALRQELKANPPLSGAYTFKKGDIVVAKFSQDGQWYRARIDKMTANSKDVEVTFIDYGNKELAALKDVAPLPSGNFSVSMVPPAAQMYALALLTLPQNDPDVIEYAKRALESEVAGKEMYLRKEYKDTINGVLVDMVSLIDVASKENVGLNLVKEGYFMVRNGGRERRKERKMMKLVNDFRNAQDYAKKNRLVLWMYGDNTEDDARDFGLLPK